MSRLLVRILCVIALSCSCAYSQEFRALISGVVLDPSGSTISGATITALNTQTGLRASTVSGANGVYNLPQLPPGRYDLSCEAAGFRKYVRSGITLNIGDKASVNIRMDLGPLTESVTVTAELTGIESNQSVTGQLMDSRSVSELPLNGRQVFMLLQLAAGTLMTQQNFGVSGFSGTRAWDVNSQLSIHGSRPGGGSNAIVGANSFMIDGAPMGITGGFNYVPLVDAVEEFKVAAPTSDASHGLSGGGVINMTMKSGSNAVHGGASWFLRNNVLDANNTQTNRAGLKSQQHQFNQFSAMIGGPIIRNKFFYMGDYDGYRERTPFPTTVTVPTLAQREGDFSQTLNSARQMVAIYDPLTTRQVGNSFVRDAFAGNRIPANRMSKVGQNVMKFFPLPNVVTDPVTNFNNYAASPNIGKFGYDSWHAKFDYLWNSGHRTTASVTENWGFATRLNNGISGPATMGPDPQTRNHYGAILDHVWTINPTTVLNARLSWDRFVQNDFQGSTKDFKASQLGFVNPIGSNPDGGFPALTFTDYVGLGQNRFKFYGNNTYTAVADLSKTVNRHLFKIGGRIIDARFNRTSPGDIFGSFGFNKGFTQRNAQTADATSGSALANLLMGYPASGGTDINAQTSFVNKTFSLYVQDDFKLSPKLTLNFGLRWDVQTAPVERWNRQIVGFDPAAAYTVGGVPARGGLLFASADHRAAFNTRWRDLQPRTGIAWQMLPKLVWRAGYGLSYLPINGNSGPGDPLQTGFSRRTPFVATIGGGVNSYLPNQPGAGTLENPYPTGLLQPFGAALGPKTQLGQGLTYLSPDYELPRVHQFNVGFDYELPWKTTAQVSYVGSRTRKLPVAAQLNAISLAERLKGFADPIYLNASVANPYAGAAEMVGTGLGSGTTTRNQTLRPFNQFTGLSANGIPAGTNSYDGLETRVSKRMTQGLTITGTYTFAKIIEAVAYREEQYTTLARVLAAFDRSQHLNIFALYELPVGRGKRFGANWGRALDLIAGNWQYNFMVEHGSGTPTAMPDATPVRDPRLPDGQKSFNRWFNTCAQLANGSRSGCSSPTEPVAWMQLRNYELRTFSSRFPNLRNHWRPIYNMSLFKNFVLREGMRLEFRGEAFNAFNSPIYGGPNTGVTNARFGAVDLDQNNFPRNVQFALRLRF